MGVAARSRGAEAFRRSRALICLVVAIAASAPGFVSGRAGAAAAAGSFELKKVQHSAFAEGTDLAFGRNGLVVAGATGAGPEGGIQLYRAQSNGNLSHLAFGNCPGYDSDVGIYKNYVLQSVDVASSNIGCPDAGKEGIRIWNAREPRRPRPLAFADTIHGSHTVTVVGGTGYAYASSYSLTAPGEVDGVSVIDLRRDPARPKVRFIEFPDLDVSGDHDVMANESGTIPTSMGCHDIGIDMKRQRAFCAGITETHVWDIRDPADPVIVSVIRNPLINIHHNAAVNARGDILVIGDEYTGATNGVACAGPDNPNGALWFYDLSDPAAPRVLSWWAPPDVNPTLAQCTSHVYGTHSTKDWLAAGWFSAGLFVIDFSDPTSPQMIARSSPDGTSFWSAYFHRGRIYANSYSNRTTGGVYVFELVDPRKG